jgi:hypothetical protein
MMQSGIFVASESFCGSPCDGLFTHYKKEEDVGMEHGKFDEELSRMSGIVDHIASRAMILFNESFAATNEREGSEIARQIISALIERGVRVFCVTHMYQLAHGFYEKNVRNALFLRAGRQADGSRTFKLTFASGSIPTVVAVGLPIAITGTSGTTPTLNGNFMGIQPPPRSRQVDVVHLGNAAIPRQCTLACYPLPGNAPVIG